MADCCGPIQVQTKRFKKAIWVAFVLNFIMFVYEFGASFFAGSQSLKADSLDFLGDAANYAVSLFVLGQAVHIRAKASILKALTMGGFGLWVVYEIIQNALNKQTPDASVMTWLGFLAFAVNVFVAVLLFRFREGDSNMQSVWLCSRNDAIGNLAVLAAAAAVAYFNSMWPDLLVAAFMAYLSLSACYKILKIALQEIKSNESIISSCSKQKVETHVCS